MSQLPTEILELIIDCIDDDRGSLLSCSITGRAWRARSLAHLFRILQVTQEPNSLDRWWSATPVAFIRVTVDEFARLLNEFVHLVRFIVHLQVGDWMEEGRHDAAYSAFLADLLLPAGHTVERLSLFGRFILPSVRLRCNFSKLTFLRTSCSQYSDIGSFSACISALPALSHVDIGGNDFSSSRASTAASNVPTYLSPPAFSAPCGFKIAMDTDSPALPEILHWIELAAPHMASVSITGSIPSYADPWKQFTHTAPLGALLQDPASRMLHRICELDLSFEVVMLSGRRMSDSDHHRKTPDAGPTAHRRTKNGASSSSSKFLLLSATQTPAERNAALKATKILEVDVLQSVTNCCDAVHDIAMLATAHKVYNYHEEPLAQLAYDLHVLGQWAQAALLAARAHRATSAPSTQPPERLPEAPLAPLPSTTP
ncbi:hypothetical protein AURDEDRAFT_174475, partial [Auricularia subglabra TFB-10046 SS5]